MTEITWSPSATDYTNAIRRLQGVGLYSTAATSIREATIAAWAAVIAEANSAIVAAFAEGVLSACTEEIETWETAYGLANDAARTLAARRARLAAVEAIGGSPSDAGLDSVLESLLGAGTYSITSNVAMTGSDGGWPEAAYMQRVLLDSATFADPAKRRDVVEVLRRATPARALGDLDLPTADAMVARNLTLKWGSNDRNLDTDYLHEADGVTIASPVAGGRVREFSPLSVVRARDMNAIAEAALWGPMTGANVHSYVDLGVSRHVRYVEFTAANGATAWIDDTINWSDRYALISLVIRRDDCRPGGAADSSNGYSGTGTVMDTQLIDTGVTRTFATGITINVSAYGYLQITNDTGSTIYGFGIVEALPCFYESRTDPRFGIPLYDGQRAGRLNTVYMNRIVNARMGRGYGVTHGADGDPIEVFAWLPTVWANDTRTTYTIDSNIDWRDRVLRISGHFTVALAGEAASTYPGSNDDGLSLYHSGVIYTDNGFASVSVSESSNAYRANQWNQSDIMIGTWLVYADSLTGALCMTRIPVGDEEAPFGSCSFSFRITATGKLGVHQTSETPLSTSGIAAPLDVYAGDLNAVQSYTIPRQALGFTVPVDSFPFGTLARGIPRVPLVWDYNLYLQRRQNVGGGLRKVWTNAIAADSVVVIDDVHDWRDRIASAWLACSTSQIHRSGSSRSSMGTQTTGVQSAYLYKENDQNIKYGFLVGAGGNDVVLMHARESDGALIMLNKGNATAYVIGAIDATPQLGARQDFARRPASTSKDLNESTIDYEAEPVAQRRVVPSFVDDPDLVCWYDAATSPRRNNVDGSGNTWIDRSQRGLDATKPSGINYGAWATGAGGTLMDGAASIMFDSSHLMRAAIGSALSGASGLTVVLVAADTTTTASNLLWYANDANAAAGRWYLYANKIATNDLVVEYSRSATSYQRWQITNAGIPMNVPSIISFGINAADGASPIEGMRLNGTPAGSSVTNTGASTATTLSSEYLYMGASSAAAGVYDGRFGQLLIFRRLLTGAEIARVEAEVKGTQYPSLTLGGSTSWT